MMIWPFRRRANSGSTSAGSGAPARTALFKPGEIQVRPADGRFKVLRSFSGPRMDLALAAGDLNQIDVPAGDLIRIAELMRQYMGFPLGVADASVVAAAERLQASEVATLDQRHFRAVTPAHVTAP
jgi:hypothetical protein